MHSLEEIIHMNSPKEVAKRIRANRLFNSGCAGHAKGGEKTGKPFVRNEWMSEADWDAQKKKKRKRRTKKPAYLADYNPYLRESPGGGSYVGEAY